MIRENKLFRLLLVFWPEIAARRVTLLSAAGLIALQIAAELLVPWPLKVIIDNVLRDRPLPRPLAETLGPLASSPASLLWTMIAAMIALAVINAALDFRAHSLLLRVGQGLVFQIRRRVYAHLQALSFAFHTQRPVGDLAARATTDTNALQDLLSSGLRSLVSNGLLLAGMLAVMLVVDPVFTLAALAVVPALAWLILRFKPRVKRAARRAKSKEREMANLAQETLVSFRVVRAFSAERFEEQRFAAQGEQAMAAKIEAGTLQARFAPAVEVVLAAGTALVVALGAHRVMAGALSVGTLLVLLTYIKSMYSPLKSMARSFGQLTGAAIASELLVELLETDARVPERPDARPAPRFRGEIEIQGVRFSYAPGRPALDGVSLSLSPGDHCVIVGPTGAGKTTLASLLPRFIDPDEGVVRIDGEDVRAFTLHSLRERIALVLQDAMLFRMSVRDNIAYGLPDVSEEQIREAARAANAEEFILRLPQGYDTLLDERGGNLSGGQRQRLTLARAFLRDAPILVLDEPTTGLDLASEALVLEALERLARGRTTLTIAHRLATIERADLVVVVENGRIVDRGTHQELLARSATYRRLLRVQLSLPGAGGGGDSGGAGALEGALGSSPGARAQG